MRVQFFIITISILLFVKCLLFFGRKVKVRVSGDRKTVERVQPRVERTITLHILIPAALFCIIFPLLICYKNKYTIVVSRTGCRSLYAVLSYKLLERSVRLTWTERLPVHNRRIHPVWCCWNSESLSERTLREGYCPGDIPWRLSQNQTGGN